VFLLDHHHHIEVHELEDKKWCDIDSTLEVAHLKHKENVVYLTATQNSKVPVAGNGGGSGVNSLC
jgi:hypothetical protein